MAFQKQGLDGYNKASESQQKMNLSISSVLTHYILQAMPLASQIFNISDYGSSEGLNSMLVYSQALQAFRQQSSMPVHIQHNDLPSNNWTNLFHTINDSPNSYLSLENVFYSAIGRSFYAQLCPSNSVHFAYAGICFHFLSKKPVCDRVEHRPIYPEAIAQMTEDLKRNLEYRLKELVPGGIFCILVLSRESDELQDIEVILNQTLERVFRKGLISEEVFSRFKHCFCGLRREYWDKILAHFEGKFEVLEIAQRKGPLPAYQQFMSDGNKEEYYRKLRVTFQVNLRMTFYEILENRSEEEKQEIIQECIEGIVELIPEPIDIPAIMQFIALKKIRD
jgi:hypothetical protein